MVPASSPIKLKGQFILLIWIALSIWIKLIGITWGNSGTLSLFPPPRTTLCSLVIFTYWHHATVYGRAIGSSYQQQGLALSKQFKRGVSAGPMDSPKDAILAPPQLVQS